MDNKKDKDTIKEMYNNFENDENKQRYLLKANTYNKLAYCTIDAAETFMNETSANLAHLGKDLRQTDKMKFKMAKEKARQLQNLMNDITYNIYHMGETEAALNDSDYLSDLIALIIDRTGMDDKTSMQIKEMIRALPSKLNIIK